MKLTGRSKEASEGEGDDIIDDTRLRPPTTAEEKLEILKRLNSAISEHRKKVGVKSILDENSQSPSADAPVLPNTEEGGYGEPVQTKNWLIALVGSHVGCMYEWSLFLTLSMQVKVLLYCSLCLCTFR